MEYQVNVMDWWDKSIAKYLAIGELLLDSEKARKVRAWAARYTLQQGVMYKRSFTLSLLQCISQ